MIHTKQAIEKSIAIWSEWIGNCVSCVDIATLQDGGDEIEEIRVELSPTRRSYFISLQQEDGLEDDLCFHWLSLQRASHLADHVLVRKLSTKILGLRLGSEVDAISLYGRRQFGKSGAIVAAIINQQERAVGIAAARYLENKRRLSRFGASELAVIDVELLCHELSRQGMEKILALGVRVPKKTLNSAGNKPVG